MLKTFAFVLWLFGLLYLPLHTHAQTPSPKKKSAPNPAPTRMTAPTMLAAPKNVLESLLQSRSDLFGKFTQNPDKYKLQIIYSQINRDARNRPSFVSYGYRANRQQYFYPASTVKLPVAMLALERLNALKAKGIDCHTPIYHEAARKPQTEALHDSTAPKGLPTIAHYIRKIFITSDNDAYNRLYEWLGQAYINQTLAKKGIHDICITHRLAAPEFDEEANRYTNPVYFKQGDKVLLRQAERYNPTKYPPKIPNTKVGKAYMEQDKRVDKPLDFAQRNYVSIHTLHELLKAVMFPGQAKYKFNLTAADYQLLREAMSIFPRESRYPRYTDSIYTDSFAKFILVGEEKKPLPTHLRIFNKIGQAYGFLIENAYVVDFEAQTEFLITAVIYVNEDEILNDNKYEYKELGYPFMANLGKVIAWHEKNRPRKYKPDLSQFKLNYKD